MKKTQIINTIMEFIDAPFGDRPESLDDIPEITLEEATQYLEDYRRDAHGCDDEYAIVAFSEATPEILVEAWNKFRSTRKRSIIADNLAEFITGSECVCEYDQFCDQFLDNPPRALPVTFLDEADIKQFPFHTKKQLTMADLIQIGINSSESAFLHEYCWFDEEHMRIRGTDTPFHDQVLSAYDFAQYLISSVKALRYFVNTAMDDDDARKVFGMSCDEVLCFTKTVYAVSFMHNTDDPWDETIECSTTDEVADLIEQKLSDGFTLVSEFTTKEVFAW